MIWWGDVWQYYCTKLFFLSLLSPDKMIFVLLRKISLWKVKWKQCHIISRNIIINHWFSTKQIEDNKLTLPSNNILSSVLWEAKLHPEKNEKKTVFRFFYQMFKPTSNGTLRGFREISIFSSEGAFEVNELGNGPRYPTQHKVRIGGGGTSQLIARQPQASKVRFQIDIWNLKRGYYENVPMSRKIKKINK